MEKIGEYTLNKQMGKRQLSIIYSTTKEKSSINFVTKKYEKKIIKEKKAEKYINNEIKILKEVKHDNISNLLYLGETDNSYYLVFEFFNGGNLAECLEKHKQKYNKKPFSEQFVQHLMKKIVDVINYLHKKNILHRDLRLENIYVVFKSDSDKQEVNMLNSQIKLGEFNFSRYLEPGKSARSVLGSAPYMDPGILKKYIQKVKGYEYNEKVDIWSLGILCYEMLVGRWTFEADTMNGISDKVEKGDYTLPSSLHKETISFLINMLQYDPKERASAEDLLHHQFLTKNINSFTYISPELQKELKSENENIIINSKTSSNLKKLLDNDNKNKGNDFLYNKSTTSLNSNFSQESDFNLFNKDIPNSTINNKKVNNIYCNNNNNNKELLENQEEYVNSGVYTNPGDEDYKLDFSGKAKIISSNNKINQENEELQKEFLNAFNMMNFEFLSTGPKFGPIVPGLPHELDFDDI